MYLENFVTYDEVEIYPGPNMNMVMGPNGTGKSSIVAAMAIGLGWHPNVLGRSKEVTEFIKYNCSRAVIEMALRIEEDMEANDGFSWDLFDMPSAPATGYITIRRELTRGTTATGKDKKGSEWRVNNKVAGARNVQALIKALNIQCDNLCQFLPQDRVSEFARLSAVELLVETEKAAVEPSVYNDHLKLIELRKEQTREQVQMDATTKTLESMQNQATLLEENMQRHNTFQQHLKTIAACEKKRPWLEYNKAREVYLEKKEARDRAKKDLDDALTGIEPLRTKEKELLTRSKMYEKCRKESQSLLDKRRCKVEQLTNMFSTDLADQIAEKRRDFFGVRKARDRQKKLINDLREQIRSFEEIAKTDLGPLQRDADAARASLADMNKRLGAIDSDIQAIDSQNAAIRREAEHLRRDLDTGQTELASLEDVKNQRLAALMRKNPGTQNTGRAYQRLQQHRSEFPNIHGPVCMEVSATQPAYAKLVENCMGYSQLLSFVATDDLESEEFLNRIDRELGVTLNMLVVNEEASKELLRKRPQLHRDLLAAGFEGMALDYIDAPDVIKYALLESAYIHLIPVAPKGITRPIESLPPQALQNIRKLVTLDLRYEVHQSKYSSDRIIRSNTHRWAEFLAASIDEGKKTAIRKRIGEITEEQRACESRLREILGRRLPLVESADRLKAERALANEKCKELNQMIREHAVVIKKLDNAKAKLKDLYEALQDMKEEPIKEELVSLFKTRKEVVLQAAEAMRAYKQSLSEIIEDQLEDSLNSSELTRIQAQISEIESRHEKLKADCDKAERDFVTAKDHAKNLLDRANKIEVTDELKNLFATLPETIDELILKIAQEQARAELLQDSTGISAQTLESLKMVKEEIRTLKVASDDLKASIDGRLATMNEIHGRWYPAIRAMIVSINEKFGHFFRQLGCLGEIELIEKDQAYDEWELVILVKFRDEEPLQRLSAQRQSGGEKSVSTILYLLAIQELSKSPFRVVDEINQGMDATNERKVHSLIVQTATSAHNKSQYFLITPKLLTDLNYHENMHILCVYNGEGMPEPRSWRKVDATQPQPITC